MQRQTVFRVDETVEYPLKTTLDAGQDVIARLWAHLIDGNDNPDPSPGGRLFDTGSHDMGRLV
jgi:hypothetical protein